MSPTAQPPACVSCGEPASAALGLGRSAWCAACITAPSAPMYCVCEACLEGDSDAPAPDDCLQCGQCSECREALRAYYAARDADPTEAPE